MKKTQYTSYDQLPLMLTVPAVSQMLGISLAGTYELVRVSASDKMQENAGESRLTNGRKKHHIRWYRYWRSCRSKDRWTGVF